ncbi:MAG TPA: glycosyltransferase family 39 protein, partial [Solirubrobacteraceae bacterium]|nr:glycosyltransferase family 39 protein [Solirubrobacteraceae bacterium]
MPVWWTRLRGWPKLPLALLVLLCLASFGARAAWIGLPCQSPCTRPVDHLLIFDEHYYVNSARVMAGLRPPAAQGAAYAHAPLGSDPNAEHPQLAKLIMAGAIEALGDGPWAWRIGSLIFGTLAILGMFALVRAANGGPWLALGASALMACDNLMLVQGRIGTLDIYVVAAMVWAGALYLWGHPLLSGLLTGIGASMKPFALDLVAVLLLYEVLSLRCTPVHISESRTGLRARVPEIRGALTRLLGAYGVTGAAFIGLLAILDQIAPPYDNAAGHFVRGGPLAH